MKKSMKKAPDLKKVSANKPESSNQRKTKKTDNNGKGNTKYVVDFPHKFSEAQVEEFREIFIFFDRNADGLISTEELGICLRSLGFLVSTIDVLDLIKKIDPNKTGEIDIRRFFQAIALVQSMNNKENEEVLKKAFQGFDKENTGAINSEEFKKIMITLGDILHESEVDFALKDLGVGKGKDFKIGEMVDMLMLKKFKK